MERSSDAERLLKNKEEELAILNSKLGSFEGKEE